MARLFHLHLPHPRAGGERFSQAAALAVILLAAVVAVVWLNVPPVASPLPIHPPG